MGLVSFILRAKQSITSSDSKIPCNIVTCAQFVALLAACEADFGPEFT